MIRLDAATVLLQWAAGGLLFLWVTTRRREVGIGYGWLLRGVYGAMAVGAVAAGGLLRADAGRDVCAALTAAAAVAAFAVSVIRRKAGVRGERERKERVAARLPAHSGGDLRGHDPEDRHQSAEFPPLLDVLAPVVGAIGLVFAAANAGGPHVLAVAGT